MGSVLRSETHIELFPSNVLTFPDDSKVSVTLYQKTNQLIFTVFNQGMKCISIYHLNHMADIQEKDINSIEQNLSVHIPDFEKKPVQIKTILKKEGLLTFYVMMM